jgi:hypothetical protein
MAVSVRSRVLATCRALDDPRTWIVNLMLMPRTRSSPMKSIRVASALALFLLGFTTARLASAQPSAQGSYRFLLEDGYLKSVEFGASTDSQGTTSGQMYFTDDAPIPDVDDPENPGSGDPPPQFNVSVTFDSLQALQNQALMGGTVISSSHRTYYGKWAQLVVEDNGGDPQRPDNLTWAFCTPSPGGWIPSDAELSYDDGAYLSWWATDAERPDDVGIPSKNLIPGQDRSCPIYPLSVYSLVDLLRWDGRLIVQP